MPEAVHSHSSPPSCCCVPTKINQCACVGRPSAEDGTPPFTKVPADSPHGNPCGAVAVHACTPASLCHQRTGNKPGAPSQITLVCQPHQAPRAAGPCLHCQCPALPRRGGRCQLDRLHMSRWQAVSGLDGAVRIPHGHGGVDGRGRGLHLDVVVPEEAQQAQRVAKALRREQRCSAARRISCTAVQDTAALLARHRTLLGFACKQGMVEARCTASCAKQDQKGPVCAHPGTQA